MNRLSNESPPTVGAVEGRRIAMRADDGTPYANPRAAGNRDVGAFKAGGRHTAPAVAYHALTGRIWRYGGKRGQVLTMLASGCGVTQWDTLPWHTRLGGTIHALRGDGLAIETQREGEYRHARYWLRTPGKLDEGGEA